MRKLGIIALLTASLVAFTGQSCTFGGADRSAQQEGTRPIELNYWRVLEGEETMREIITQYTALHPNVTIKYRKFSLEDYESALIDALAEDRGPDLFSIQAGDVERYLPKLAPMPPVISSITREVRQGITKETVFNRAEFLAYTPKQIEDIFVPTVAPDVIRGEEGEEAIYGLPLSVDTMVLYYNKDLLNNAGIAEPPKTWTEFEQQVKKLTVLNPENGTIMLSGAAFGGGANVERSADIVATLMMQNGTVMTGANGQPAFDQQPANLTSNVHPAVDALRFYTDFAAPTKETHTWDESQPQSFEAFAQGRTAFFFGYSYRAPQLREKSPRLQWSVAPMPQLQTDQSRRAVTANYWLESVSKKSKEVNAAWDFVRFATQAEQAKLYLAQTGRPTALRSIAAEQIKKGDTLSVFAEQLIFAKNWYHGRDVRGSEAAFVQMITEAIVSKGGSLEEETSRLYGILSKAAQAVKTTY